MEGLSPPKGHSTTSPEPRRLGSLFTEQKSCSPYASLLSWGWLASAPAGGSTIGDGGGSTQIVAKHHRPRRRRPVPAVVGHGPRPLPRALRGDRPAALGAGGADSRRRPRRTSRGRVAIRHEPRAEPIMAAPEAAIIGYQST